LQQLAKRHKETFDTLSTLQSHILDEQLITWKRQQQLAGNGAAFEGSLEMLQQW
jgi:signal transducer and activator of transcription 5B